MRRELFGVVVLAFGGVAAYACANGENAGEDGGVDASDGSVAADVGPSKDAQQDVIKPGDAGCPPSTTLCGAVCVDTQSDPNHCGTCSNACSTADAGNPGDAGVITAVCVAGQCGITCDGGLTQCAEQCFDEKNDPSHCGGCNTSCDGGLCNQGSCCAPGDSICSGACVDTTSDNANCGQCGKACDAGSCVSSACQVVTSYKVGQYTPLGSVGSFGANYLLGEKVTLTKSAKLIDFGLIDATSGQHVVMALYTDSNGAPGSLVAYSSSTLLANTDQQLPPNTQASLSVGTYWIMAVYDVTAGPTRDNATNNTIDYIAFTFGGTLPTTFPTPTSYQGQNFNYYLVVQ